MKGQQLPLPVQLRETASYDSFFPGPNLDALGALRSTSSLLLFGPASAGKTHLLQACSRETTAAYLPLRDVADFGIDVLDGYANCSAFCLDDIDAVCNQRDWNLALLRLLDNLRARTARIVISSCAPPERMNIALPDLRTRLGAIAIFGLKPLDDGERAEVLRLRAHARGLELPEEVSAWLLTRLNRDTGSLLAALGELDRAALLAKRRLTLPFVQSVLAG